MKEIKLTIDGKEVALTAEQIKALGIDVDDGCVCDMVGVGKEAFYVTDDCNVYKFTNCGRGFNKSTYESGNYYRSESYAKQVALHQKLNNLLRRYSEQHGGDAEWDNNNLHCVIYQDTECGTFYANNYYSRKFCGEVYFNSKEVANLAIEEVVKPFMKANPDFVW